MPKEPHTHTFIHTVRLCDIFVIIFHLCFHLNLHSYQSLYCFCFIVLGKVICHDLCGHRNCFSSVDGQSRHSAYCSGERSYSWGHLYFCSHSFSLQKQQILYTLEGNWRAVHAVKLEHCVVWHHRCHVCSHKIYCFGVVKEAEGVSMSSLHCSNTSRIYWVHGREAEGPCFFSLWAFSYSLSQVCKNSVSPTKVQKKQGWVQNTIFCICSSKLRIEQA